METRILLGCRETPQFVTKEFHDAMLLVSAAQAHDSILHTDTIAFHVPAAFVACPEERDFTIRIDDVDRVPYCKGVKLLGKWKYRYKRPRVGFDRYTVYVENVVDDYFALLPHARYDDVVIHREQQSFLIVSDGMDWLVVYRQVFCDPHTTTQSIWFAASPKYQIEIRCRHDFRQDQPRLQALLSRFLPSSFR